MVTPVYKVHIILTGWMRFDQSFMTYGIDVGKKSVMPVWQGVITGGEKIIMFDTGFGDPNSYWNKKWGFWRDEEHEMVNQLAKIGLKPEDIGAVVNSHLHLDHAGNNALFKHADFYVQEDELRYAYAPDVINYGNYDRIDFDHDVNWCTIRGDAEIFPGIHLLFTPGHTPYHQSMTVETADGVVILCGDACYQKPNWYDLAFPGTCADSVAAIRSLKKLKAIRNSIPLMNHDLNLLENDMNPVYG
jgi:glyoxylase-like metal-dependent hydrolase (beta-lactamase superfamily II)